MHQPSETLTDREWYRSRRQKIGAAELTLTNDRNQIVDQFSIDEDDNLIWRSHTPYANGWSSWHPVIRDPKEWDSPEYAAIRRLLTTKKFGGG